MAHQLDAGGASTDSLVDGGGGHSLAGSLPGDALHPIIGDILNAILKGDTAVVVAALQQGLPVNATDELSGKTALHFAAAANRLGIVQLYVEEHHADVNFQDHEGSTPLMLAVTGAKETIVDYLLDHGADPTLKTNFGSTAVDLARDYGLDAMTAKLVGRGGPPPQPPPEPVAPDDDVASIHTDPDGVEVAPPPPAADDGDAWWGSGDGSATEDALYAAMSASRAAAAAEAKRRKAEEEEWEATKDERERAELERRARELAASQEFEQLKDQQLFFAAVARGDDERAVEFLVDPPAWHKSRHPRVPDVNCREEKTGQTALHMAATQNRLSTCVLLVETWKAAVNAVDIEGCTPLYVAAANNSVACIQYLLTQGGDQSIATRAGHTPLSIVQELGFVEARSVLSGSLPPPEVIKGVLEHRVPGLVEAPEAFPPPGTYNAPLKVVLFSKTPGALVYGTTLPTVPCREFDALGEPVVLNVETTLPGEGTRTVWLRAMARKEGIGSDVSVFQYHLRSEMAQWWTTLPPYLQRYEELLKREGYDTLAKVLHRLPDPMAFRHDLQTFGILNKFCRGELMRHFRAVSSGKWRNYVKDSAPEGPGDTRTPEEIEFQRAKEEANRKAAGRRAKADAKAAEEAAARAHWPYPTLPRSTFKAVLEKHTDEHQYKYGK